MRLHLVLALAAFSIFTLSAARADDVRLDHKGMSMDMPRDAQGEQDDISTDALSDAGNDMGDSGSGDLAIRIERGGFASDDDSDTTIGGNGPLSRDGGFNFGSAE